MLISYMYIEFNPVVFITQVYDKRYKCEACVITHGKFSIYYISLGARKPCLLGVQAGQHLRYLHFGKNNI